MLTVNEDRFEEELNKLGRQPSWFPWYATVTNKEKTRVPYLGWNMTDFGEEYAPIPYYFKEIVRQ